MTVSERSRDDHLEWCKCRAREYMAVGRYDAAVTSMLSDLKEHSEWRDSSKLIGAMLVLWAVDPSPQNAERIIEGFR